MRKLLFAGLFFICFAGFAQQSKLPFGIIGLTQGFGYYIQSDLKDLNELVKNNTSFELQTVNNFPVRPFFGGYLTIPLGVKVNFGVDYCFHSTGSRIGQKDYSGSYSFDQVIKTQTLSVFSEILLGRNNKSWVYFHLNAGLDFSTWEITEKMQLFSQTNEDKTKFVANCPFVEPAFVFKWQLYRKIGISVRPAYHFGFGGKYHNPLNHDIKTDQKPGWNGPRISLNVEYSLFNQYETPNSN
jgi:hypothetical protein